MELDIQYHIVNMGIPDKNLPTFGQTAQNGHLNLFVLQGRNATNQLQEDQGQGHRV